MALTITSLGSTSASGTLTVTLTISAAVPAGATIVVLASNVSNTPSPTSIADSSGAGNVYTSRYSGTDLNNLRSRIFTCEATNALTSGVSTITVTFSNTGGVKHVLAAVISGLDASPFDQGGFDASDGLTATSNSVTTGTLAQADSIVIGGVAKSGGGAITSFGTSPAFTEILQLSATGTSGLSYAIVASTSAVSYTATTGLSVNWITGYVVLKYTATPPAAATGPGMSLMGVG